MSRLVRGVAAAVTVAGAVGLVAGCGVPMQSSPEVLVVPTVPAPPTPTVTNRPDPTPTPTPSTTPTEAPTPPPPTPSSTAATPGAL